MKALEKKLRARLQSEDKVLVADQGREPFPWTSSATSPAPRSPGDKGHGLEWAWAPAVMAAALFMMGLGTASPLREGGLWVRSGQAFYQEVGRYIEEGVKQ